MAISKMNPYVSICICTFRRPEKLSKLLFRLINQIDEQIYPVEIIIVDNDNNRSAKPTVDKIKTATPIKIKYYCELIQNISLARNKAVSVAKGDLIIFIDDDEYPSNKWLDNLLLFYNNNACDGVFGPVKPVFEVPPPSWIIRSKIFEREEHPSGYVARLGDMRTGNVLLKRNLLLEDRNAFDPKYGLVGGEDTEFFKRMTERGYKFLWCQEATVFETIPKERLTIDYQIKRALGRGKFWSMMTPFASFSNLRSLAAIIFYFCMSPFIMMRGLSSFNRYLIKASDHLGKLLGYLRINRIEQYK